MEDIGYEAYKRALAEACRKFEELHPRERQPDWLKYCMSMMIGRNDCQNWVIKMILRPKAELQPGTRWELGPNRMPFLIHVDPDTGKRSVVICGGPAPFPEVIFAVEADIAGELVRVLADTDLSTLDGAGYEMNLSHEHIPVNSQNFGYEN